MTQIAVLGTGTMGTAIARRLLDTGHSVTVWNRTAERAAPLALEGAAVATEPQDAVRHADVVILMLTDGPAVKAVLDAVQPGLRSGAAIVQMSTIGPDETVEFSTRLPAGVSYVDSPVAGSIGAVEAGSLSILTGGDPGPAKVVLEALGTVVPCGSIGAGAATKLVVNTAMVAALSSLRDALAVADAFGVSREAALTALNRGPLAGAVGRATAPPGGSSFAVSLAAKDLRLALERVDSAPVVRATYDALLAETDQRADVATLVSDRAGKAKH